MARVDENDQLGYLTVEKALPWGKIINLLQFFEQSTLLSNGFPYTHWLLFIAIIFVICSLGTLIYFIYSVYQAKKLGAGVTIFAVFTFRYKK